VAWCCVEASGDFGPGSLISITVILKFVFLKIVLLKLLLLFFFFFFLTCPHKRVDERFELVTFVS
jgi:hypothetical protein